MYDNFIGVQALREVSFSMNKGEVFVLLGHNGAGKSTLINIITGQVAPTHGKVFMMGLDVENDSSQVQQIIGVCPQDDILWDDLTAREHMLLVAAFKGIKMGPLLTKVRASSACCALFSFVCADIVLWLSWYSCGLLRS